MTDQFWAIFAAVLGANLLTAAFIWGAITYTRLEREGREETASGRLPLLMMLMPAGFLLGSLYLVLKVL